MSIVDLDPEFVIFSSGCLDLSVNIPISYMTLVRGVKKFRWQLILKTCFVFSKSAVSHTYRNIDGTKSTSVSPINQEIPCYLSKLASNIVSAIMPSLREACVNTQLISIHLL